MSDLLLEESNVQPVSTPVTVCGDIHGQVWPSRDEGSSVSMKTVCGGGGGGGGGGNNQVSRDRWLVWLHHLCFPVLFGTKFQGVQLHVCG